MASPSRPRSVVRVTYGHQDGRVALVRIDNPAKLGALDGDGYFELAQALRDVAARPEVVVTVLTGTGRFFSAYDDAATHINPWPGGYQLTRGESSGADVAMATRQPPSASDAAAASYQRHQSTFGASNLFAARAFYAHPKILVAALNGPAVGLSAALVAHADLIYCTPQTFLLTPFSSLGLVAEGGASRAFVARMGSGKASEALLLGRRIGARELAACGFVNGIFDPAETEGEVGGVGGETRKWQEGDDERFLVRVLREVDERLGPHLAAESLLGIKRLMRRPDMDLLDAQNAAEVFAGVDRFMTGVPQEEFRKLATGEKRHKL